MRVRHALVALVLHAAPAAAQEVRGTLFDSLRTRAPIADALITVDGRPERTRTDRRGRFVFDSLPEGTWYIRYAAPWLDSLSLPPLLAQVSVRAGERSREIRFATPTLARLQMALCGTEFDEDRGILRGELRDASGLPHPGVFIGAVWSEAVLRRRAIRSELIGTIDTTDATGMFSLCGVPRGTTFLVRAGDETLGTGNLYLRLDDRPVVRRDLTVGPRRGAGRVSGRLVSREGVGVRGAIVSVPGDSTLVIRTSDDGQFTLEGVPRRSTQLFVRAIGFTPQYVDVAPIDGEVDLDRVTLFPVAQELAEVRVTARAETAAALEFEQRRRSGTGIFIDEETIKRYPRLSATVLQNFSTRVRSSGGSFPTTRLRAPTGILSGGGSCRPRFFLDGVDWGVPADGVEEADILSRAIRVEIHPAPFMPERFTDFNGCGVVLVWTQ